jgi:signal transduction histidine kinase
MGLTIEYRDIIIMLHNIMDNFRLLATEKNINFSLQTTLPSVFLWIDSDKFEKIIFNLLSNAFKYTPDNKVISLYKQDSPIVYFVPNRTVIKKRKKMIIICKLKR